MKVYLLRRKSLGKSSVRGIIQYSKTGIEGYRNDGMKHEGEGYVQADPPADADLCIRWGCTSSLVNNKTPVLNRASAIHYASDKANSRKEFASAGIAPRTHLSVEHFRDDPFYPAVVRPPTHAQGKNLDVCRTLSEVEDSCRKYGTYYISEFIDKVREFRAFICQGRVVWVAEKTPADPKAYAWNVAQGGKFDNVRWGDWPIEALDACVTAYHISELDFGGVDVMLDKNGRPYVLEINSAPSQTSPYRQQCVAKAFDWLIKNGKEKLPLGNKPVWQSYIHPGVVGE